MKSLAKISLLSFGLVSAAFPAFAAEGEAVSPHPDRPVLRALGRAAVRAHVLRRLELNADQVAQFKARRAATVEALKAIRADETLTREQKLARARQVGEAARAEMRAKLTPEQQAKLDALRERIRERQRSVAGPR